MNKPGFEAMRAAMVDNQLRTVGVTDPRIVGALSSIPRERFVPEARRMVAYVDDAIEVSPGRYLNTPMAFGRLLSAVRIGRDERVLLIGAATGYGAAVIAQLARAVIAVEDDTVLAAEARARLAALGVGNVSIEAGPLAEGWAPGAPYDAVFVDGAIGMVPQALIDQLRDGGRFAGVVVERGVDRIVTGVRSGDGFGVNELAEVATPRLPGFEPPSGFKF